MLCAPRPEFKIPVAWNIPVNGASFLWRKPFLKIYRASNRWYRVLSPHIDINVESVGGWKASNRNVCQLKSLQCSTLLQMSCTWRPYNGSNCSFYRLTRHPQGERRSYVLKSTLTNIFQTRRSSATRARRWAVLYRPTGRLLPS